MDKKQGIRMSFVWIITILWGGIIFYLSSQNGVQTTETSSWIAEKLAEFIYDNPTWEQFNQLHMVIRRTAHICLFFGLGLLLYISARLSFGIKNIIVSLLVVAVCGLFDEWHKQFISGRHFDKEEVVLNICCGIVGIVLGKIFMRRNANAHSEDEYASFE